MNPEPLSSPTSPPHSILERLPIAELPAEERSRAIREIVSLAMEGPLDRQPLSPMPVPGTPTTKDLCQAAPPLSPLPSASAPLPPGC